MKILMTALLCVFASTAMAKKVEINKKESKVTWTGGKKFTDDTHTGYVAIKEGTVNINDKKQLVGGTIIIDMTKIESTDQSGTWKKKLEGHLHSADFFDTANNKEASFKITKVEPTRSNVFKVTGNLTIRKKTNSETVELKIENKKTKEGEVLVATGDLAFDRIKYDVSFNKEASLLDKATSVPKDKIIKDKIDLKLKLQTQSI